MATTGPQLTHLNQSTRRMRAKLIAAIDLFVQDIDRAPPATPRELRLIVHPDGRVEPSMLMRYPIVTDQHITSESE
jgi:hypothetical protein